LICEHHRYGNKRSQFGELYLPGGTDSHPPPPPPYPVAVVIHGGFWRAQYSRKLMHGLCRDLAERGWAAWNLEYRRLGGLSGGGWPNTFEDLSAGIDHLHEVLAPLDLERVVTIGHSAGGHLAALAATRPWPRVPVTAVVSQAGVLDLERAWEWRLSKGVVRRLLGGTPESQPERYGAASPAARLPVGVPVLLTHGGEDDIVPPAMSEEFQRAALAAGDECELVLLPGEGHFGHLEVGNPLWEAVVEWIR
jgi:acetyl esterase/lipase